MAPRIRPAVERFEAKTRRADSGCLEWTAYIGDNGYGRFYVEGRGALAHRWSYEHYVGPIPEGLVIDHLCRNHACVEPSHLEPVTPAENVRRGEGPRAATLRGQSITHCPEGHEYTDENTYLGSSGRTCLTCKRANARKYYERNREVTIERSRLWRINNLERSRELTREAQRRQRQKRKAS